MSHGYDQDRPRKLTEAATETYRPATETGKPRIRLGTYAYSVGISIEVNPTTTDKAMRYERVYFAQEHDAIATVEDILHYGPESTLEDLAREYHYLGEHDTCAEQPHGTRDETYSKDGYTLSWNSSLPYVGLTYDTEHEPVEEHRRAMETKRR